MKKEVAEKWVAALRSGKYQQGILSLKDGDRYCCLGVLCEISGKGVEPQSSCELPRPRVWSAYAGMRGSNPNSPTLGRTLATANDDGASFNEIADAIEKDWEVL